eukprot:TRINITY_DN60564_c0_g1_i1.p1 TRINITY_DN60564_c0_g1~~TRINITY_DN60564_c0_g1_i1.p1  ORF type:complete len:834 (+),score=128.41 TRINITY_DN60564_c0_g1_i1:45-2546(+)
MARQAIWAEVVWEEHVDSKTGLLFYHNRSTGMSKWIKPEVLPFGWTEHVDLASKSTYYYNAETGESTWTKPQTAPARTEVTPSCTEVTPARTEVSPSRGAVVNRRPLSAHTTRSPVAMTASTACTETTDDWREHANSNLGKVFYVNTSTGEFSWSRPTAATAEGRHVASPASDLTVRHQEDPWTEHVDPATGMIFYHSATTKKSVWKKPVEPVVDKPLAQSMAAADRDVHDLVKPVAARAASVDPCIGRLPHGWTEHVDRKTGRAFYHNEATGDTTWEKPTGKSERRPAEQSTKEPADKFELNAAETTVEAKSDRRPAEQSSKGPAIELKSRAGEQPVENCKAGPWQIGLDPRRGKRFYYSAITGDSFWEMPQHLPVPQLIADLLNLSVACQQETIAEGPSDRRRFEIRDGTKAKVAKELGLSEFGRPVSEVQSLPPGARDTTLFLDSGKDSCGGSSGLAGQLLGRFDVLALPATADLDASWRFTRMQKKRFWVLHAAALNIGESVRARDFPDYRDKSFHLDLTAYIEDMGRIFDNLHCSAAQLDCLELVWFPFGMGAFLRKLHENDAWYSKDHRDGQLLVELRHTLAQRWVASAEKTAGLTVSRRIHICVSPSERGTEERDANAAAFLKAIRQALRASAEERSRRSMPATAWVVHVDGDALIVAQELANQGRSVALVNGANRNLIGNHWFADGARLAIDENLHRRSWTMSALAYVLNHGTQVQTCSSDTLAERVRRIGGRVEHQTAAFRTHQRAGIMSRFREMDRDGNGFVSKGELAKVVSKLGLKEAELDAAFCSMDADKDGQISYVEFVNWVYGWDRPKEASLYAVTGDA